MTALTHKDHSKIEGMRRLLRLKSKCDNSNIKLVQCIGFYIEKKINTLDKTYFKPRLEEICKKENILRISTSEFLNRNFSMFLLVLQNKDVLNSKAAPKEVVRCILKCR